MSLNLTSVFFIVQFVITIIIGLYFYSQLKNQEVSKTSLEKESKKKLEKLFRLRKIKLTEPLAEKTRPSTLSEIVGQEDGIKALKAALCGPNPQHIIIYGPPGVGKTAAARVILEEAKKLAVSPFGDTAKFVEMDATTLRFDERGIADPLIGSVHDPIYQGAGAYGPAGVPQPKEGAVTKAHGGILFIDEIGELHSVQLNKLLKVLEDRKVLLESSYYSSENSQIPSYVHDIFKNGLPADFRLVGATTRTPDEIPPAIRSRCTEIFFRPLRPNEIKNIVENCAIKGDFQLEEGASDLVSKYADNGRDAVNIVQTAGCTAIIDERQMITVEDVEWVLESGHYNPKVSQRVKDEDRIGCINGLGVFGTGIGRILEVEVNAKKANIKGHGKLTLTGFVQEEEINRGHVKLKRDSTAKGSIENVLTLIENITGISHKDYDIHINIPGGVPVDGPSAGTAIFCAVYSAVFNKSISSKIAMTGEVSIAGYVLPVGGVQEKVNAASQAGVTKVYIPMANYKESYSSYKIQVIPVNTITEILDLLMKKEEAVSETIQNKESEVLTASKV
ncbi:ATP-dependent protease LonB [Vallitalea okinawensis]|uniref:ATP-dependent protease LonB n=1 Tax=Vallitalea okinawensis TaxID=2078660 RepID=UPI000CFD9A56|nr:ATP-dependent protease LonB [Vallitalea okinawensis]